MSDKVLTLRGKRAVWAPAPKDTGPIDPARLPEGVPYYEKKEVEVFPETTLTTLESRKGLTFTAKLIAGETYKVTFNGTEYACVAGLRAGAPYLGNLKGYYIDDYTAGSGEPFCINCTDGSDPYVFDVFASLDPFDAPITLKITGLSELFRMLNRRCLPVVIAEVATADEDSGIPMSWDLSFSEMLSYLKDGLMVFLRYFNSMTTSPSRWGIAIPFEWDEFTIKFLEIPPLANSFQIITVTEEVAFDNNTLKHLPKAAAVADVTAAPTADEFNALLASLRAAGYLATE